jgi:vancomycin resistance protein VanW
MKKALKQLLPHSFRVELRRAARGVQNVFSWPKASYQKVDLCPYPTLLVQHSSKLMRTVKPHQIPLQLNKIHNLRLASALIDGTLLRPGAIFSFCKLIGRTTYGRGYLDGLEMHESELVGAPGGGLCQLANLIFWLAINLDLQVIERHKHDLDLFPDDDRVVPFGMGASVFYNYRDLRFRNNLTQPLVLSVSVQEPLLVGGFYSDRDKSFDIEITQSEHRFFRQRDGQVWRENRVLSRTVYRDHRSSKAKEIAHNLGRVCYEVPDGLISADLSGEHETIFSVDKKQNRLTAGFQ